MINKLQSEPIIILGFGRSGTTWISDIISKSIGGLVLFEPFHPEVFSEAQICCYHNGSKNELLNSTSNQIESILSKKNRNKWLIRNHLSTSLEEVNGTFANQVWENCNVIGYKSIRQNFMVPWLYHNVSTKILFVKRDLLSVVSSLLKRKQFWNEFGFDVHEKKFLEETLESNKYDYLNKALLLKIYRDLKDDYLKMAFIWIITHEIVEKDLSNLGIPVFNYNDFYLRPYETTKEVLSYLGCKDVNLHPSYFFTPSMLTLRTFHKDSTVNSKKTEMFWKETLSTMQVDNILNLQEQINIAIVAATTC